VWVGARVIVPPTCGVLFGIEGKLFCRSCFIQSTIWGVLILQALSHGRTFREACFSSAARASPAGTVYVQCVSNRVTGPETPIWKK
jgi:hypothetical protein